MPGYNLDLYEAVLGDKAIAVFRKTIPGKVNVKILDPIDSENKAKIEDIILEGDTGSRSSMVKIFSEKELAYFRKANAKLIEEGILEELNPDFLAKKSPVNEIYYTEEEIEKALTNRYHKKFEKFVNEYATSGPRLARVIEIARKLDLKKTRVDYLKAKAIELGIDIGEF